MNFDVTHVFFFPRHATLFVETLRQYEFFFLTAPHRSLTKVWIKDAIEEQQKLALPSKTKVEP